MGQIVAGIRHGPALISELPGLVYLELEERHTRDGGVAAVNSLPVCEFNDAGLIKHLDVYLQQPR